MIPASGSPQNEPGMARPSLHLRQRQAEAAEQAGELARRQLAAESEGEVRGCLRRGAHREGSPDGLAYYSTPMWTPGDRLLHRFNRKLGPGVVKSVEGRRLTVEFPEARQTLVLATGDHALVPLAIEAGKKARLVPGGRARNAGAARS